MLVNLRRLKSYQAPFFHHSGIPEITGKKGEGNREKKLVDDFKPHRKPKKQT